MDAYTKPEQATATLLDDLMQCMQYLDELGASQAAAHLDAAIHAYRSFLSAEDQSSEMD